MPASPQQNWSGKPVPAPQRPATLMGAPPPEYFISKKEAGTIYDQTMPSAFLDNNDDCNIRTLSFSTQLYELNWEARASLIKHVHIHEHQIHVKQIYDLSVTSVGLGDTSTFPPMYSFVSSLRRCALIKYLLDSTGSVWDTLTQLWIVEGYR